MSDIVKYLEHELAACQRSLNAAKQVIASKDARQLAEAVVDEAKATLDSEREANARLTEELAACQANNKVLRDALFELANLHVVVYSQSPEGRAYLKKLGDLMASTDDSALKALLAAQRERCFKAAKKASNNDASQLIQEILNAIRALGD